MTFMTTKFELKLDDIARKRALYVARKFAAVEAMQANGYAGQGRPRLSKGKGKRGKHQSQRTHRRQSFHN